MDRFKNSSDSVSDPARSLAAISATSPAPLNSAPKAIFIGSGGDVSIRAIDDESAVTLRNVPSGTILPIRAAQLDPALTTARDIVGLY
ncbi:hypothetical protein D2V17_05740 [Aurantiacibacter xanthus]|uniref:Uncharacterized protein n=1 Tax=Aurantiacibacter xanthus TaxID=1784712 RepID=A0A3A1P7M7_9SPHN|nr:hypothetical protein [Aurantiacibacter xanthus]RIV89766.1 hypothetical protein D2V17_05740 [Aurantiacibacter xanthus]